MRLCRAKSTGEIFAMKKLKKSEMLSRGQVPTGTVKLCTKYHSYALIFKIIPVTAEKKQNSQFINVLPNFLHLIDFIN